MKRERHITASRLGRLSQLGRLAGGIVGGAVSESARQLVQGSRPSFGDIVLTPSNARRMAERLSEMRGAAMKVGQLLSMDSGQLLPPEVSEILGRLRDDAHQMPLGQVAAVLGEAWGEGWEAGFRRFNTSPLAAASIGQVHEATLKGGPRLAVKIQYPGISSSIDSDVDNVATLLRVFKLLPDGMDIDPLLQEAKTQLHAEADYRLEAEALKAFQHRLQHDDRFSVPEVLDEYTTREVLAMAYLDGQPIESLQDGSQHERDRVATHLLELFVREIFDWGIVQTDPNFANYLYQPAGGRIELLDFGATREYTEQQRLALRELLAACIDGDTTDLLSAARKVGYLDEADDPVYREFIVTLLRTATEPARQQADFAFGDNDLARRVTDNVMDMRLKKRYGRIPPVGILFLHRKIGGLYLLLSKLNARVPVRQILRDAGF